MENQTRKPGDPIPEERKKELVVIVKKILGDMKASTYSGNLPEGLKLKGITDADELIACGIIAGMVMNLDSINLVFADDATDMSSFLGISVQRAKAIIALAKVTAQTVNKFYPHAEDAISDYLQSHNELFFYAWLAGGEMGFKSGYKHNTIRRRARRLMDKLFSKFR